MVLVALAGLGTGLSLIVAIGAQNAFVLRQGLRREHVLLVVAICAALRPGADPGRGGRASARVVERRPGALTVVRWVGAAFLLGYGLLAARARRAPAALEPADGRRRARRGPRWRTCLALTWLNPHVYLDTVLLLGSVASQPRPEGRWWFGAGAGAGSVLWFSLLGFGARVLTPVFRRPTAWRVLDGLIAAVMLTLAGALVLG